MRDELITPASARQKGYIEGLQDALAIVENVARFGIDKAVAGIKAEITKSTGDNNVTKVG